MIPERNYHGMILTVKAIDALREQFLGRPLTLEEIHDYHTRLNNLHWALEVCFRRQSLVTKQK